MSCALCAGYLISYHLFALYMRPFYEPPPWL